MSAKQNRFCKKTAPYLFKRSNAMRMKKILIVALLGISVGCSGGWNADDNVDFASMCIDFVRTANLETASKGASSICACVRDEKVKPKYPSGFSEANKKMEAEELAGFIKECR